MTTWTKRVEVPSVRSMACAASRFRGAAALLWMAIGAQIVLAQSGGKTVNIAEDDLDAKLERYIEWQYGQPGQNELAVEPARAQPPMSWSASAGRPDAPVARCSEGRDEPRERFSSRVFDLRGRAASDGYETDAPILACSFSSFGDDGTAAETAQSGGPEGDAAGQSSESKRPHEQSLDEINNKLNNPGADLAQLRFKFTWNQFKGDLGRPAPLWQRLRQLRPRQQIRNFLRLKRSSRGEGASSQNSLVMLFQPVVPFKLHDGGSLILRPTIPVVWQPYYNAGPRGFDEQFGLGDSQIVGFYSRTNMKKGYMWGVGAAMQFPTHTDDSLGKDQFQMGPAGFAGLMGKWGSAGLFPQHLWNIGGSNDGYTASTALQLWYWFNVGGGYQVGGSPIVTYDWAEDDSDEAWTVPVNLGVAKTIKVGELPIKLSLEAIYYIEQPDSFGPHWGLQLTIAPVIPNPFERHGANG